MTRISDTMALCTVRLHCTNANGRSSLGTSFYHAIPLGANKQVPVLITNRHVVEGYDTVSFTLTGARSARTATPAEKVCFSEPELQGIVVYHEDPAIDLAAILIGPAMNKHAQLDLSLASVPQEIFIDPETEEEMGFAENLLVVGYPQGFWDENLNLPIFRQGITASPAMIDYNGESKFLIDCSIYPGSSGSPVFLYNGPTYLVKNELHLGERFAFLGVVSAVMLYNATGAALQAPIPTHTDFKVSASVPNNLGVVVKACKVSELIARVRLIASS